MVKQKKKGSLTAMQKLLLIIALIIALSTGTAFAVPAQNRPQQFNYEIRGGLLAHDVDNLWSQSSRESGADISGEIIFWDIDINSPLGILHPNAGLTLNNQSETSKVYAGVLLEKDIKQNIFLEIGLGLAAHNGKLRSSDRSRKWLGSRLLFRIPIEIGRRIGQRQKISIAFDHISNASLASPNEGMDTLGIRYGYLF